MDKEEGHIERNQRKPDGQNCRTKRFIAKPLPDDWMSDQETVNKPLQIVHNIKVAGDTQIEIDNMYKEFTILLMDQMEDNLHEIPYNNKSTGFRKRKPLWSAELAELWKRV